MHIPLAKASRVAVSDLARVCPGECPGGGQLPVSVATINVTTELIGWWGSGSQSEAASTSVLCAGRQRCGGSEDSGSQGRLPSS